MQPASDDRWIGRGEALDRLGVKAQTLYAYVSRGRITARPDPLDPRRSLYAVRDIARLTGEPITDEDSPRAPPGGPPTRGEADLASSISFIADGRLFFRGLDAVQLSETATLEDVSRRLWGVRTINPFAEVRPRVGLTPGGSARARLFAALARRAEEDAEAKPRSPETLAIECARVLDEAVDAVAGPGPRLFLHQRLARSWKAPERDAQLIRRALVLSADAGLDAAVLAVRAAAAGGASPAACALAGLAVVAASDVMSEMTRASSWIIAVRRQAADAARRAHEAGVLAGFGDRMWPGGDPRAAALLQAADLPLDLARAVAEGEAAAGRPPAFSLALAAVSRRLELPREGAQDLMLVGRLAGLLGHALDQMTDGSPIRARLRYVGPEPGAN
ncbi:citrate/2-methylcitrate synthase [Brevundimonas lenta]|uniref:Citrate synthase n=1 Tax=Brevundimonas lenta TaxID=424796 RepID=A0A7W6JB64_9CAUL|nr:citrate/2-methylcitrate synthase [Brevundimonas lenta]MBB4081910.1 citrate synthase [Brevundimonas lenta]